MPGLSILSYMFDRLLKMPLVLNKPGFWIWHGCICKDYADFLICLIMVLYASIMPEYAWICLNTLNVPQYNWILLNVPEYMPENTLINCSDYARVLNIPRDSYNNIIIIVTNVIMLEFLSVRFIHPVALLRVRT